MRTKQAALAVFTAATLMGLASQVQAGPVTQLSLGANGDFANPSIRTHSGSDSFADSFSALTLNGNTWVSGKLLTDSNMAVDVTGVFLVKLDSQGQADLSTSRKFLETVQVDWDNNDYGSEQWDLAPVLLSAGTWELRVDGSVLTAKRGAAYTGQLQTGNTVPEPQSLALSLVALLAMAGLSRRGRKA